MGKMLRIELSHAFRNKIFAGVMLFCVALIALQVYEWVLPSLPYLYERRSELQGGMPPSLFLGNAFLGFGGGLAFSIFQWTLPILIVLPYAGTAYTERKYGYIKNVFLRTKKRNYYISKYTAVFLSGGTVAVLPILLSLWVSSMFLPALLPQASSNLSPIMSEALWGELFYQNPIGYIVRYLFIQFVFYGLMATISLAVSFVAENRFIVLLTPFLLNMALTFICSWIQQMQFAPSQFLDMRQMIPYIQLWIIALEAVILFLITSLGFIMTGCHKEVY